MANKNHLAVIEFEPFTAEDIGSKAFEELKAFASYEDNSRILSLDRGGKALKARNYVGVIETKSGFVLEILPKVTELDDTEYTKAKNLLMAMLRTLKNAPFVQSEMASLKSHKQDLLELFIGMFIDELNHLVRKGIKSDYLSVRENQTFLKGKLLLHEHLKHNLVHKEKFYTEYDVYSQNRAENRLIGSTIELLMKKTRSNQNSTKLRELRFMFDDIPRSIDVEKDFKKVKTDRTINHYSQTILWCRLFLRGESFTAYKGKELAFALLFPMERIFESFVSHHLKFQYKIKTQHQKMYLVEEHADSKIFQLRPDIVGFENSDAVFVADTKWKRLDQTDRKNKYSISQTDMYQLFAYGKKYSINNLYLLYPSSSTFDMPLPKFSYDESLSLYALPFDVERAVKEKSNYCFELPMLNS